MVWNHFFMSGCLKSFVIFRMSLATPLFKLLPSGLSPTGPKGYANNVYLPIYGSSSIQRYPNCKTFKAERPQCPLSVSSVANILTMQDTSWLIKDSTLGKSHMNVNSVESVSAKQDT